MTWLFLPSMDGGSASPRPSYAYYGMYWSQLLEFAQYLTDRHNRLRHFEPQFGYDERVYHIEPYATIVRRKEA